MAESKLADVYYKRDMAYYNKKDYARASDDFEKALKFKPDNTTREWFEMAKAERAKY